MNVKPTSYNFSAVHAAMRRYTTSNILSGVSHAVLQGRDLIDVGYSGWANREKNITLDETHLFRIASNTKLITSIAVLMLIEDGLLSLSDPIESYISQLGNRQVLQSGATDLSNTEPAKSPITIAHLLSHSSGLSYGLLDPGSPMFRAYNSVKVLNAKQPLSVLINVLENLPLSFHPGTAWEYSIATDVLGYLIEVVSGKPLDAFFAERIFTPLGMNDTFFFVPPDKQPRLAAYYRGADRLDVMKPGLSRIDTSPHNMPYMNAFLQPMPRLSGGGGLVSSLPDMVALIRSLMPGDDALLKPHSMALMMGNQLASGVNIGFPPLGKIPGKVYSVAGSLTQEPLSRDPAGSKGELQWGGIYGTHWWISPNANLAGILMTQREMGFWHPFSFDFKNEVYAAVGA